MEDLLESYINGNHSWVKEQLAEREILLSELLEDYINQVDPDHDDILLFVKRLEG